jgi:SAM-dependent methyltransferase
MRFRDDFLRRYLRLAPAPLAIERSMECLILSKQEFRHPVLDIGCGDGLFAHILFDEPVDLGIDPDTRELESARKTAAYRELIKCPGDSIPKEERTFNTIFSNSALEHIPDLEPVLREARRLLADDGSFYVTLPTDLFEQYTVVNVILTILGLRSCSEKFRARYNSFWSQHHHYPRHEWTGLFERCGFRAIQTIEYGSKNICRLDDFLVPFSLPSWITKKIFHRWSVCPSVRSLCTYPIRLLVKEESLEQAIGISNGGLIFFELKKGA